MENSSYISRRDFLKSIGVTSAALGLGLLSSCSTNHKSKIIDLVHGNDQELLPIYKDGKYIAKDFEYLSKNPNLGLSEENILNHIGLYKAYVEKVNKAEEMMRANQVDEFSLTNLAFSLNGMALHDIYFANMTTEKSSKSSALLKAIEESFSSFDNYQANLIDTAMKVKGWSMTGINLLNGKIFNYAEDTHSSNYPSYFMPIMVLDVYDHAWLKQFGEGDSAKREYIDVFNKIINWDLVSRRFDAINILFA